MYKVMLADDEGIVIDALTFIIEKNFPGKCTIEHAKTGRAVIELAERFSPDIIFMDIQMPGINGIEAMKEIRKKNKDAVIIVVSAYDKFDYASESINLGVYTYINKPIDQKVIVENLQQVMEKVDAERDRRSNDLKIREKLNTVVPILESGFIYSILLQESHPEELENYKNLLNIEEDYGYVLVVKYGESQVHGELTNPVGMSVRAQNHYMDLREGIKEVFPGIVGSVMSNMVIAFIPSRQWKENEEYEERVHLIEKGRKLVTELRRKMDARFRIGIGSVRELTRASESYMEAANALRFADGSVVHAKDLPIGCWYESNYPVHIEEALFEAIKKGDVTSTAEEANRFFEWMEEQYREHMMDVKIKVLEFILFAEKIGYESGGMVYQFQARNNYLETIMGFQDYEMIHDWFLDKMVEACRNVKSKKAETSSSLIERAKVYIQENYCKDLSLDDVSKEANVSPYYFSKLFKEEAGENFIEYLTKIRVSKAKDLLITTGKTMKEICLEVGYSDPNYFSRLFKRHTGKTPTEFKEGK